MPLARMRPEKDPKRALYPPSTKSFQALAYYFVRESLMVHFRPLAVVGAAELQTDRTRSGYLLRHRAAYEKAQSISESGRAKAWETALSALDILNSFITENGDPQARYFAGDAITFTDLHIASNVVTMEDDGEGCWIRLQSICDSFHTASLVTSD